MSEKITPFVSAQRNGDVAVLFHMPSECVGFQMTAQYARWLSTELKAAADREEDYAAPKEQNCDEGAKPCTK